MMNPMMHGSHETLPEVRYTRDRSEDYDDGLARLKKGKMKIR